MKASPRLPAFHSGRVFTALVFSTAVLLSTAPVVAQAPAGGIRASDLDALSWRELGPAITSGRITAFAVDPQDARIIFAASASGGAWKTENGGTTWRPVFHKEESVSLGALALDPANPDVIWVGTGEQNSVRSSSFGNGVYRSQDGGDSWQHMGLEESRHVGRILIHPNNSQVVFVAAMGSLWGPNPERGLYRTTDGGAHWEKVLEISDHTGVVEVRMDPGNPDILFAAAFQRERRQWSMVGGGPEGGLFRSDDGGDSWTEVGGGFPTEPVGRIGITYCPSAPNTLYASAVGPQGGIFRSRDGGTTWERRNAELQSHWYYGELICDPQDPDRLYVPMTPMYMSEDGGLTFRNLIGDGVHVDHHVLWVNPQDPEHLMVGNDGGIYISRDRGESWLWQSNLPVMQLYTVSVDMQEPFYHVYGGTQDNGSWGGPVGTRFNEGVSNEDWTYTAGGDGFFSQVDPMDSDIIYAESQYGVLTRLDRKTGERKRIQPWQPQEEGAEAYRWNWSAPLLISPHDHETLYFSANVVFRSHDQGDSWEVISPDLTRGISRDSLPLQGTIQPQDAIDLHASTALFGNITTLAESSLRPGLLAVGTDDGLIQISRTDGGEWHSTTHFPGVPEMTKVSGVAWSSTSEGTLFAVFDGHKDNTFRPFVVRTQDFGQNWEEVTGNLPAFGPTRSVSVHPGNGDLIFVGTELGIFFSNRGGSEWHSLGKGLPTVAVHGIAVHPREDDLILGTHGRGFWVLDHLGLLKELTPEVVAGYSHLATPRRAFQIRGANRGRGSVGSNYFTAKNPPRGAILDYWIGAQAVDQSVVLEVLDQGGTLVRRLQEPPATRGAHRTVWDLRHDSPSGADGRPSRRLRGRFVLPGSYQIRLIVGGRVQTRPFQVEMDPALLVTDQDRLVLDQTLALQAELVSAVALASAVVDSVLSQTGAVLESLVQQPGAPSTLREDLGRVRESFETLRVVIEGPGQEGIAQQETLIPLSTLATRLYSTTEAWTGLPTADQSTLTIRAHGRLVELLDQIHLLLEEDLPELHEAVTETGIEWPVGLIPALPKNLLPRVRK